MNGIKYSKFRQYCYFVDGISTKYSVIKKYLEMEFDQSHDQMNKIPITLELRNIPTTIASLCNVHGMTISTSQVHQINEQESDNLDNCRDNEGTIESSIKRLHVNSKTKKTDSKPSTKSLKQSNVQCWLCDGPHSFHQCNELTRMKTLCIKRPQVLKHFQDLLLKKEGIKVLMDASEFFDGSLNSAHDDALDNMQKDDDDDDIPNDQVNSLQVLQHNTFTTFENGIAHTDITCVPTSAKIDTYVSNLNDSDESDEQDFYVLAIDDEDSTEILLIWHKILTNSIRFVRFRMTIIQMIHKPRLMISSFMTQMILLIHCHNMNMFVLFHSMPIILIKK